MKTNFGTVKYIIIPGLVFQSTMIGGGYATGKELVEFFLVLGPSSGLLAMLLTTVCISVICAIAFAFAHRFGLYDYRSFFKQLLGKSWVLFEVGYLALGMLVLSVLSAAAGALSQELFNVSALAGILSFIAIVSVCLTLGSGMITRFLSYWSVLLYTAMFVLIAFTVESFGAKIASEFTLASLPVSGFQILSSGVSYTSYNIVVFTATLFCLKRISSTKQAVTAGLLCGPLSMLPGVLLFIAMVAHFPAITTQVLPLHFVIEQLNSPSLLLVFQIIILGTFIETAIAIIHSVNQRIETTLAERTINMPRLLRTGVAAISLVFSVFFAEFFGLLTLIKDGYRYSAGYFLLTVTIPLLTIGVAMLVKTQVNTSPKAVKAPIK